MGSSYQPFELEPVIIHIFSDENTETQEEGITGQAEVSAPGLRTTLSGCLRRGFLAIALNAIERSDHVPPIL